jgi:4-amino-4-deoxy-L-arabinose transferase-like glycosyltransferase
MKSEFFKNTKFSILSGFLFGMGMLTKWTYFFFMIGPVLYLVFKEFFLENRHKGSYGFITNQKISLNFLLFIITSIFIFGPYYFPILPDLLMETFRFSRGSIAHGPEKVLSFSSALFYPAALWKSMISPFGFVLFVLGTIRLLYSKSKHKNFLIVSMLVPYFIFTFMIQNKSPRYFMPSLPTISLIISFLLVKVNEVKFFDKSLKILKYSVFVALVISALVFFSENKNLKTSFFKASREKWRINELVSVIESDLIESKVNLSSNKKPLYVGVIPSHRFVNGQTIRYYFALRRIPVNVIKLMRYQNKSVEHFINNFDRYKYVVTKTFDNSVIPSFQEYVDDMHLYFYSKLQYFNLLLIIKEPDNSEVKVYKRKDILRKGASGSS